MESRRSRRLIRNVATKLKELTGEDPDIVSVMAVLEVFIDVVTQQLLKGGTLVNIKSGSTPGEFIAEPVIDAATMRALWAQEVGPFAPVLPAPKFLDQPVTFYVESPKLKQKPSRRKRSSGDSRAGAKPKSSRIKK